MSVRTLFNHHADRYDRCRKQLIPCFDAFYRVAIEAIPFARRQSFTVLDLGAGTGLMAEMVAARYPAAAIDLLDIAENMLAKAEKRLKPYTNAFTFRTADYSAMPIGHSYDVIISALSIHHLEAAAKRELFGRIFASLTPGGIFINADQVAGDTEHIERTYRTRWNEEVLAKGVSTAELNAARRRMQEDRMSTLAEHISWLRQAGFAEVNCWYKNYSFAVVSGTKCVPHTAAHHE